MWGVKEIHNTPVLEYTLLTAVHRCRKSVKQFQKINLKQNSRLFSQRQKRDWQVFFCYELLQALKNINCTCLLFFEKSALLVILRNVSQKNTRFQTSQSTLRHLFFKLKNRYVPKIQTKIYKKMCMVWIKKYNFGRKIKGYCKRVYSNWSFVANFFRHKTKLKTQQVHQQFYGVFT